MPAKNLHPALSFSDRWTQPNDKGNELEYLRFAIDQAASVSVSDLDGNITFANDKFLETAKYTRAEVLGRNHRILSSGYHSKDFFQELWATISSGRIWKGDVRNKTKDGEPFWMDTTIIPFLGKDGRPYQYMAIRHNITKQKLAEATLQEERARQVYAERLAALGEMQAGIAHEIKNPLAVISLQAQLLRTLSEKGTISLEKLNEAATRIENVVDRIAKIIHGLQTFSRNAEADPFEQVPIKKLVKDAVEFCRAGFEANDISITASYAEADAEILCRPAQISQVFLNLINNARDAIQKLPVRWIKIHASSSSRSTHISVTDSGTGISAELQGRIMEPFFSTKAPGKGSGLGLSISRKIMEAHGGTLKLDPKVPNTCFVLEFPKVGEELAVSLIHK